MTGFEPEIIGFLCNWCAYEAADSAGRARRPVPANFRIVRVMCSGRVDPGLIMKTFRMGADGVIVMACRKGECHYKTGNIQAQKRMALLAATLEPFGIETDRLRMAWISAGDRSELVKIICDMTECLRKLGPLGNMDEVVDC